ncbi:MULTISPECIES: AraC family transcriptional regulator [unclassified Paenibacillus]|uniref:AraC family transcriptional regulator n=1 Tax=unclassified Paenibacillus TaxID=185978 RepID=UPI0036273F1E
MQINMLNDGRRGVVFWKNLGLVLLITCLPMVFIGVILYYVGTERIGAEVDRAHQVQLKQSIQQMDEYLSSLEKFAVRIAFDPTFDESLNRMDFTDEFQKTKDLMKSLTLLSESNSLVHSVGLFLRDADKIVGDESGIRPIQTEEDRRLFRSLLDKEQLIYWDYSLKQIHKPGSSYKTVVIRLPGGQMHNSFGAFLIYLNQDKLDGMVQKLSSEHAVSFLINDQGEYLTSLHSDDSNPREELLEEALRSRIMQEQLGENSFKFMWDEEIYFVSYGKISKLGGKWTVISATPLSQIIAPVSSMSRMIISISSLGLLIGLLLSWFASNKIYAPIQRLKSMLEIGKHNKPEEKNEIIYIENEWKRRLQEQQALSAQIKQSIPALRESFLLQFLQGNLYTHTQSEILGKMKQLEWEAEHKKFAFLVANLHGFAELGSKYSERDVQLITFAASNIMLELSLERIPMAHVMNFQDLSVGVFLVLNNHKSHDEIKQELSKLAQDFITALNNVLRMKATLVISKITESVMEAPDVLEQTRKALHFRDLKTSNQMLDMSHFILEHSGRTRYPFELEREIVTAIGMGLEDEAVRLIRAFMLALQSNDSTEWMVHQGMMKLLGAIHDTIIRYDVDLYTLYDGMHVYEQLVKIYEPDEMVHWFQYKLIQPFIKTLSMAYDADLRGIIEELLKRIQNEFLSDVSLELYAEQLQMSSSKLSKAFKQITGINFIDYIVQLRIEKCKELLFKTDMKINDIAGILSYQPSYLIRIFKKSEGMTPGQYREKHAQGLC